MSSGEVKRVSIEDIQLVQNLIERCLQLYMPPHEVVSTLLVQAKIEPGFTELVWQKLEVENQEFFKAYYLRLIVKDQILRFNQLLEKQAELMQPLCPTEIPLPNGSQIQQTFQPQPMAPSCVKPENVNQTVCATPIVYSNGISALPPHVQGAANMMGQTGRIDESQNVLLGHCPNTTVMQGMNRRTIKPEAGYGSNMPFPFVADNNGEGSVPPCDSLESSSHALNETILEQEMNSYGFLGQIPRSFSLSDLTADFSSSADILESYSRSPFPRISGEQDIRRLDTISEGLSYEDFRSQ